MLPTYGANHDTDVCIVSSQFVLIVVVLTCMPYYFQFKPV